MQSKSDHLFVTSLVANNKKRVIDIQVKSWMVVEGDGPLEMTAVTVIKQSGYAYGFQETFSDKKIT